MGTQHTIRSLLPKPISFKTVINDNFNNPWIYWDHLNTLIKGENAQQHNTLHVENNELTSDPNKVAKAFNVAFVNIEHKYIDVSLQGTPDIQKLRSFASNMKPSGELFNIPPIRSCFVKEQVNWRLRLKPQVLTKLRLDPWKFVLKKSPILFETVTFPDIWKIARVTPIFKSGDKSAK